MVLVPAGDTPAPFPDDPLPLLREGAIEKIELIPWGSNYTFITVLADPNGGEGCLGVYKPRRGEAPLRDFPSGTLYKREVAAYHFSEFMGWGIVPPTVIREEGPHGVGSMQLFVQPVAESWGRFDSLRTSHAAELRRIALFDLLTNNADRKGGHCLLDVRGHLWGIDHGLTYNHVPKLRTVIWDVCGHPIPEDLLADLRAVRSDAGRLGALREQLEMFLAPHEMDAFLARWDRILANPCFPDLDPYRNVPWPPF